MKAVALASFAVLLVSSCGDETTKEDLSVATVDYENRVFSGDLPWVEFSEILKSCDVIAVFQAHDKSIDVTTSDQRYYTSVQPRLDAFYQVMKERDDCKEVGQIAIGTE